MITTTITHYNIPAWLSSASVQTEMSQSGVPWKLSPLAVDQQHCLEESCHPVNGTSIVLVLPLSSQAPPPSPSPPHTYRHIFHILQCTPSQEPLVRVMAFLLRINAIKVVLYAVENITQQCVLVLYE